MRINDNKFVSMVTEMANAMMAVQTLKPTFAGKIVGDMTKPYLRESANWTAYGAEAVIVYEGQRYHVVVEPMKEAEE
jgi:hypothetical protein